jgi:hypothetical protein
MRSSFSYPVINMVAPGRVAPWTDGWFGLALM